MGSINLEDLLKTKKQISLNKVEVNAKQEIKQITEQTEILTAEEVKKVHAIKETINLLDSSTPLIYGIPAQRQIAQFSDSVLESVRTKDSGQVGELLNQLVCKVKSFDTGANKGSFIRKIPILNKLVNKTEQIVGNYKKLSVQVEDISNALEQSKTQLMQDIIMFDKLYEKNLEYFKELQLYIKAGEEKIEEIKTTTLPHLRQQAKEANDSMAIQVVNDFEQSVDRFDKKIHDLKISKTLAIQTAPQIRLIQNNDRVLIDKVQAAIYHTIPLWKNQIVIALGLSRQEKVLKMQRAVTDTTNELLRRNAEMLKQNTIDTAIENERGIIDIDTLKKVNEDLITTIEETIRIQSEGRTKRQEAEKELIQIENRLKDTLLNNSSVKQSFNSISQQW